MAKTITFSCEACGRAVTRESTRLTSAFCNAKCSAEKRHKNASSYLKLIGICAEPSLPTNPINLEPDMKIVGHLLPKAIQNLQQQLSNIANAVCTKRQLEVFTLYFEDGLTQEEIAKKINIAQCTVHQSLYGIQCISSRPEEVGHQGKWYGGAIRKIKKELAKEPNKSQFDALLDSDKVTDK